MGVVARVCVCIGVGGAIVLSLVLTRSPAYAQSVLLDSLASRVTLASPGALADEVTDARIIRSGDTVATDATGRAVVTYPDGSTALLEENSALTIEFVRTDAGDYAVRMRQTLGRVWYAVTRAVTLGSRYEVRSAGMASVIRAGSDSYVAVTPDGGTTVTTIHGTVDTSAGGAEVSVPAGSSTTFNAPADAPSLSTPVPATPAATATPTFTGAPTTNATPTPHPAATLPPVPVSSITPTRTPPPATPPIAIPKPLAAPTPLPTPLKDKFGPRKDAPGQPPPKSH
jgi:hypothetical protein